jgi:hypothetical protein
VARRALPSLCCLSVLLAAAALLAAPAGAEEVSSPVNDQGSSYHYRSLITSVTPAVTGLSVQVLQFADRLQLINHTGKTVTIFGYSGEPYVRVLADGTVERNVRSPATYLNQSFYGDINVPPQADASAPPQWQLVERTGQFEWHDHRIHFTSPAIPPEVKDQSRRTLIFDWKVPIEVGTAKGAIAGQLFWEPENSSTPLAAIIVGVVIVLGGLLLVLYVRRRRARTPLPGGGGGPAGGAEPPSGGEAW